MSHCRTTPKVFVNSRELRHNQTEVETKLWQVLRAHQTEDVHFRRHTCPGGRCQGHAIGNYVVDFCSPRQKLIIELDGGQHLEQEEYSRERTVFLERKGFRVLRFWNNDVIKDLNGVMRVILDALE